MRGQYTTLKTSLVNRFFDRQGRRDNFLQVLDDIDIEVPFGRAFGIIGRNGSGKSTLLKLIAGILKPDAGSVSVQGRISPLIELGAGFHPEFSGRENIHLNAIVLGLSRAEIDERFDAIVDFAELRDFIDDPVRTYSSGMYMRLGFSIAVHASPDILLIDEILSVGDEAFSKKCERWLDDFLRQGKTVILVSHSLQSVERWCREAVWLENGRIRDRGSAHDVIARYQASVKSSDEVEAPPIAPPEPTVATIAAVRLVDEGDTERTQFRLGDTLTIEIGCALAEDIPALAVGLAIYRADGLLCYATTTHVEGLRIRAFAGQGRARCQVSQLALLDGSYRIEVAIFGEGGKVLDRRAEAARFVVATGLQETGVFRPTHDWRFDGLEKTS